MKMKLIFALLLLSIGFYSYSQFPKNITLTASEPDVRITVNGQFKGTGSVVIKIMGKDCATIVFEKPGFITSKIKLCNDKYSPKLPKVYSHEMIKDESYDASVKNDLANYDIEIETSKSEIDAWKLLSQIILSYFDVVEITDKETGYLRTSWQVQSFNSCTIRTRVIVKQSFSKPLKYKVKLCSEISNSPGTSVKEDEKFMLWDRVLRKYENLLSEIQARLK